MRTAKSIPISMLPADLAVLDALRRRYGVGRSQAVVRRLLWEQAGRHGLLTSKSKRVKALK